MSSDWCSKQQLPFISGDLHDPEGTWLLHDCTHKITLQQY
jgi:hypothetical protein